MEKKGISPITHEAINPRHRHNAFQTPLAQRVMVLRASVRTVWWGGGQGGVGRLCGETLTLVVSVPCSTLPQSHLRPLTTSTEKIVLEETPRQMDGGAAIDADGPSCCTGPPPGPCHILQPCSPQRASRAYAGNSCRELSRPGFRYLFDSS